MTHLRTPRAASRQITAIAAALALSTALPIHAQTPVDANPAPPPPAATAPAVAPTPVTPMPPVTASTNPASPDSSVMTVLNSSQAPSKGLTDLNAAARDSRALNPLLLPTDNDLRTNLDYGRSFGETKQDFIDLLNPSRRSFDYRRGGMLGEKRRPDSVAVWLTPDLEARWRGFLESRTFADQGRRDADFTTMQQEVTAPQQSLVFLVEVGGLISGHSDPTQQELDAAVTSIAGTRFVLSDDRGNNFNSANVYASTHLVRRQDFYDVLALGPDHLGQNAFGDPTSDSRSLVLRRKPYSDYAAEYIVTFDAFNADGSARINRDVHSITLRVITPDEAKYSVFDLDKMP